MKDFLKFTFCILFISLSTISCSDDESSSDEENNLPDVIEIDSDGDGLIEIYFIEQLNAIRFDLDADGIADLQNNEQLYFEAFPNITNPNNSTIPGDYMGYEIKRSLDFNDPNSYASGVVDSNFTEGEGWKAMGEIEPGMPYILFSSQLEGNFFTISNLFGEGLFSNIGDAASFNNIGLIDVDITYSGALFSYTENTVTITNCYVDGGIVRGAGGLAGGVNLNTGGSTVIDNCYTTCDVVSSGRVGGLLGSCSGDTQIKNSYTTGNVSSTSDGQSSFHLAGGIIAQLGTGTPGPNNNTTPTISNCFSSGNINGKIAGGIAGWVYSQSTVINCYTSGDVQGLASNLSESEVGTIAGMAEGSNIDYQPYNSITNCYSIGKNLNNQNSGSVLVGSIDASIPVVASYYNIETSGAISNVGDDIGLSIADLQSPTSATGVFSNWQQFWDFGTSIDYPALTINGVVFRPE